MFAFSRAWIASATALGGLFPVAEHCRMVSSGVRRGAKTSFAVGNAALIMASALAGSGAGFCWACATATRARARTDAQSVIFFMMILFGSALQAGGGNLAAFGILCEIGNERDAHVRAELQFR